MAGIEGYSEDPQLVCATPSLRCAGPAIKSHQHTGLEQSKDTSNITQISYAPITLIPSFEFLNLYLIS